VSKRGISSGMGLVKGWCIACQRFSSGSHSKSGKSTTHKGAKTSGFPKEVNKEKISHTEIQSSTDSVTESAHGCLSRIFSSGKDENHISRSTTFKGTTNFGQVLKDKLVRTGGATSGV
jgi:hypothetical protein